MQAELLAYGLSAVIATALIAAGWAIRRLTSRVHRDPFAGAHR